MTDRVNYSLDQIIASNERRNPARRPSGLVARGDRAGSRIARSNRPYPGVRDNNNSNPATNRAPKRPSPSEGADFAIKFLIPRGLAGSIIGNGGSSMKELMEITGANVRLSNANDYFPGTNERVVYIWGDEDAVLLAQGLMWELIGQQTYAADHEELVKWSPAEAKANPGRYDAVEVEGRLAIPASVAGAVIGRGGATIRSLSEDSSIRVSVSDKDDTHETYERIISLKGSASGCMHCASQILAKIKAEAGGFNYVVKGTTYQSSNGRPMQERRGSGTRSAGQYQGDSYVEVRSTRKVPAGARNSVTETLSANSVIELAVPNNLIGAVIGPQGATLNEIISLSGAKVVVSNRGEFVEGTNNRLITITGTPANAQTAHTLISHRVQQTFEA